MKALKAFIKPFAAPQRSVKIKIQVNVYFNTTILDRLLENVMKFSNKSYISVT